MSNTILRTDSLIVQNTYNNALISAANIQSINLSADNIQSINTQSTNISAYNFLSTNTQSTNISAISTKSSSISAYNELIIPTGTIGTRPPPARGSIRFNTETISFEGWNGSVWAGLGGLNHLDGSGNIDGSRKASIGPAAPLTPETHDVWYDTVNKLIKYYSGSAWLSMGAVYL